MSHSHTSSQNSLLSPPPLNQLHQSSSTTTTSTPNWIAASHQFRHLTLQLHIPNIDREFYYQQFMAVRNQANWYALLHLLQCMEEHKRRTCLVLKAIRERELIMKKLRVLAHRYDTRQKSPLYTQSQGLKLLQKLQMASLKCVELVVFWRQTLTRPWAFRVMTGGVLGIGGGARTNSSTKRSGKNRSRKRETPAAQSTSHIENYLLHILQDAKWLDNSSLSFILPVKLTNTPLLSAFATLGQIKLSRRRRIRQQQGSGDVSVDPSTIQLTRRLVKAERIIQEESKVQRNLKKHLQQLLFNGYFVPLLNSPQIVEDCYSGVAIDESFRAQYHEMLAQFREKVISTQAERESTGVVGVMEESGNGAEKSGDASVSKLEEKQDDISHHGDNNSTHEVGRDHTRKSLPESEREDSTLNRNSALPHPSEMELSQTASDFIDLNDEDTSDFETAAKALEQEHNVEEEDQDGGGGLSELDEQESDFDEPFDSVTEGDNQVDPSFGQEVDRSQANVDSSRSDALSEKVSIEGDKMEKTVAAESDSGSRRDAPVSDPNISTTLQEDTISPGQIIDEKEVNSPKEQTHIAVPPLKMESTTADSLHEDKLPNVEQMQSGSGDAEEGENQMSARSQDKSPPTAAMTDDNVQASRRKSAEIHIPSGSPVTPLGANSKNGGFSASLEEDEDFLEDDFDERTPRVDEF